MNPFRKKDKEISPVIDDLNMVSHYEIVKPNYTQNLNEHRVIDFIYTSDKRVVLLGSMDGQYPYWVSETDIDNIETNTSIMESILHGNYSLFIREGGDLYWKLKNHYRRRIYISGNNVRTPFDHGYSNDKDQLKYWGRFIAQDIFYYHNRLKKLCEIREFNGRYLEFLQSYLETLKTDTSSDPVKDYENKKILMELIRSEDYLLLSDNKEIRELYIQIRDIISELYNTYMTIVR